MQGAAGLSRRPQAFLLLREKQALRLFKYASRLLKCVSRLLKCASRLLKCASRLFKCASRLFKCASRLFKYASRLFKYASRRFHKGHKGLAKGWVPTLTLPCGTPKARGTARNTSAATRENGAHEASVRSFTFWENKLDTVSEHRSMLISLSIQTGHAERARDISSTPVIPHSSW